MSFSRRACLVAVGVLVSSYCLSISLGSSIQKRSAESLYDNIYSAISDFTANDAKAVKTVNDLKSAIAASNDLPEVVRTSRQTGGNFNNNNGGFSNSNSNNNNNNNNNFRPSRVGNIVVDGFPNGLPEGTPEGVKLALASMAETGIMTPIPGEPNVDYPILSAVPDTGFSCAAQNFLPGIYGDVAANCQVFYMCGGLDNSQTGFLCPNGTIFNQQYFICDWWYNVDCAAVPNFYGLNEFLYQDQPQGKKCTTLFCSGD